MHVSQLSATVHSWGEVAAAKPLTEGVFLSPKPLSRPSGGTPPKTSFPPLLGEVAAAKPLTEGASG